MTGAAEIAALDAGGWFSPAFAGEPVPRFEDAIRHCLELGLGINVELKPCPGRAIATAEAALAVLRPYQPAMAGRLLISSFEPSCLEVAKELAPQVPRGHLFGFVPRSWLELLERYGCATLHADHLRSGPRRLRALKDKGAVVILYTVNDPARARKLLAAGAAAVITDRVGHMIEALGPAEALGKAAQ